jgi:hypothetical protein
VRIAWSLIRGSPAIRRNAVSLPAFLLSQYVALQQKFKPA